MVSTNINEKNRNMNVFRPALPWLALAPQAWPKLHSEAHFEALKLTPWLTLAHPYNQKLPMTILPPDQCSCKCNRPNTKQLNSEKAREHDTCGTNPIRPWAAVPRTESWTVTPEAARSRIRGGQKGFSKKGFRRSQPKQGLA